MRLSAHFTFRALTRSDTARVQRIDNGPPPNLVKNLAFLARKLDAIRAVLHGPLEISSGFRSRELNSAIGGSRTSRHTLGLAADFICRKSGSPFEVCRRISRSTVPFDQLIYEFGDRKDGGWIHVSFAKRARRKVMTISLGHPRYRPGLHRCFRPRN